jgi:outer membrane protein OmpA-like peptidoglycan-associated protein
MCTKIVLPAVLGCFATFPVWCQPAPADHPNPPIYSVTVVERTVSAVNYQYRGGPTTIDFRGTVLMPHAKGEATVESKTGRTGIDAKFDRVDAAGRFGPQYLTYVLWAVTPDGHAKNLGEVLTGSSDKGHLHVTTDLQAFGLIVTAEPYAAVRLPSDVVVMENRVRPDTIGSTQPINVKYELMPRGTYTFNMPAQPSDSGGPKVSMARYESLVELYQAQNAVQIAQAQGAGQYAPEVFSRAQQELQSAQQLETAKASSSQVVTAARQAAETAEDARSIAVARKHDQDLSQARAEAAAERQKRIQADAAAQQAQAEAAAEHQTLEAERNALRQVEARDTAAAAAPAPPPAPEEATESANRMDPAQSNRDRAAERANLLSQLSAAMTATDTPRGLVVTVSDGDFRGGGLVPEINARLARIASIVAGHPGLLVRVEGNTDADGPEAAIMARQRAEAVRTDLLEGGLRPDTVSAESLGNSRLITSNASAGGRQQNRRVEIVISGSAIGSLPYWDKAYSLNPQQ